MEKAEIRKYGIEAAGRFYGLYYAIVTDNSEFHDRGKLKVKLTDLAGATANEIPVYQKGLVTKNMGIHWVPKVGDIVIVEFRRGFNRSPYWTGSFYAKGEKPNLFNADDIAFLFPDGSYVKNNHKDNITEIHHKNGYDVVIDNDGIHLGKDKKVNIIGEGLHWDKDLLLKGPITKDQISSLADMVEILSSAITTLGMPVDTTIKPMLTKLRGNLSNLYTT